MFDKLYGTISFDNVKFPKTDLLKEIPKWESIVNPYSCILLQCGNNIEWWSIFFACLKLKKRIFLIDQKEKNLLEIAKETNAGLVISNENTIILQSSQNELYSDAELILRTSGTTGKPKNVIIPWTRFFNNLIKVRADFCIQNQTTASYINNCAHLMGLMLALIHIFWGGDLFLCSSLLFLLKTVKRNSISIIATQESLLKQLLQDSVFEEQVKKMEFVCLGGDTLSPGFISELAFRKINAKNCYGKTECLSIAHSKAGCGLVPLPGVELSLSSEGELLVKGDCVNEEYFGGKSIVDENGFHHTGDLAEIYDGYFFLKGRIDNVVIINGYKINLQELELRLLEVNGVKDALVYYKDGKLSAEIVSDKDVCAGLESLKSILHYYEKVEFIFLNEINLRNNKKVRVYK